MKDTPFDTIGDEPVEARIVSWVLGEASAFEAAELERLCEERPELLVFRRRMRALHGLLTEVEAAEPDHSWKLPEEKRKVLDEIFGEEKPARPEPDKESQIRRSGRRALLAIAACVMFAFVVIRLLPREYESEVIIEVKPRQVGMFPQGNTASGSVDQNRMTPEFFGTEFEKIKSRNSLSKVVENLELADRWKVDKNTAVQILKSSVTTENIEGTDLIALRVRNTKKEDAQDIATEVARNYKNYRAEIESRDADRRLVELNKAIRDQEDKVEERRKVLATIVRTKGIVYKGQDSFYNSSGVNEDQGAQSALETYKQLAQEKQQLESQANSLQKYDSEQAIVYASGLNLPDNTIKDLYPKFQEKKQELEALKTKGLAENHPTVKASKEELEGMKRQMDEGVIDLRARMQAELAMTAERLKSVEIAKNDSREESIKRGLDAQDYVDAKRDFESDQQLLQQMKLKQVENTIAHRMAPESIEVHNGPEVTTRLAIPFFSRSSALGAAVTTSKKELASSEATLPPPSSALADSKPASESESAPVDKMSELASSSRFSNLSLGEDADRPARPRVVPPETKSELSETDEAASTSSATSGGMIAGGGGALGLSGKLMDSAESKNGNLDDVTSRDEFAEVAEPLSRRGPGQSKASTEPVAGAFSVDGPAVELGALTASQPGSSATGDGISPVNGTTVDGIPADPSQFASNGVTNGLRSGDQAINRNNIDAILNNPNRTAGGNASPATPASEPASLLFGKDLNGGSKNTDADLMVLEKMGGDGFKSQLSDEMDQYSAAGEVFHSTAGFAQSAKSDSFFDREKSALPDEPALKVDQVRRGLYTGEGNLNLGKYDEAKTEYQKVLRADPYNAAARAGLEKVNAAKTDYYRAAYDHTRAELLMQVDKAWELKVPAEEKDVVAEKAKAAPAKKSPLESMEEIAASEEPYSTFSLNINDASFQVAKAALDKGERPDPAAIKVEQFYNAVDYGDPAPASNEPVAARIEQSAHPVIPGRNIVRVALKTAAAGRGASQPLRLTLLVDQSGSMVREDRRSAMSDALKQLGGLLTKNDHITVVGFSRESHLLADNWTGDKAGKLGDLVNQTASEGGTNLEQAINLGEQMAARPHPAGEQNRIVLFTDGAANLGNANPERLAERVKALRQKGISFDIAGIGADGVNDRLLSELARNGNGRYYVVGDTKNESFARQLAGAFRPAAENVKVQVRFNPDRVGNYKLIGFEKDRLKTEDFRNDSVDAAELAAEEAGVAIYQVETLPQGSGEIGEVSVRFRDTSKGEMVERKWTMPFESTTQPFDRATPSMQLAGLSMLAAEKLKGGPLADAIDFKQLTGPQSLVKQFYGSSPRVADMLHVIDAIK